MNFDEHTAEQSAEGGVLASYGAPHEHLADLLARHDWLLRRQIARGQARKPADILGFAAISEAEVQRLLDEPPPFDESTGELRLIDHAIRQVESEIDARVEQSRLHGVRLPII